MSDDRPDLHRRCGSCARFVRVIEDIDASGEVKRHGECLLAIWPAPLYETSTCSKYVKKGTFTLAPKKPERTPRASRGDRTKTHDRPEVVIPEELLDMDADEFRKVLRQVIHEELVVAPVDLGGRWQGGELVLVPGNKETAEKRVPLETFFHKIVMIRDRLRVLEQKVNGTAKHTDEEKVQHQQYITQCYGTLTTFNVLFADKNDGFVGQKTD